MILGDSLLVMTTLAEKEGLKGKVQMIYLDPPYGIKFGSNWQVSTRKRDVKDGKAEDATRQPEQIRAFRDTWKLGIHSYLAYLRDRLVVARELLTETGSIFVQIGDENVHLVRCLMDEVFGSENFVSSSLSQRPQARSLQLMAGIAITYVVCKGQGSGQVSAVISAIQERWRRSTSILSCCKSDGHSRREAMEPQESPQSDARFPLSIILKQAATSTASQLQSHVSLSIGRRFIQAGGGIGRPSRGADEAWLGE